MPQVRSDDLAVAVVIAALSRGRGVKRLRRLLEAMSDPALSPDVLRFKPGGFDATDAARRRLCAEAREQLERIAPLVRALEER